MTYDLSWVPIVVAFLVTVALLFVIAKAIKSWVFELSPGEWAATCVLCFDLGALTAAYLDNDGLLELITSAIIVLAIIWWIVRLLLRYSASHPPAGVSSDE